MHRFPAETRPTWIRFEPERYGAYASGVEGGLKNPLGARALHLHREGRDTLYRIHGTNEPDTIGRSISSGCIRLFNQDIVDLHRRIPIGTSVTVLDADAEDRTVPSGSSKGVLPYTRTTQFCRKPR
ncbi:L,D-transpeptidase [Microvirga arvi]|uniref:L,D-transpeptidase n=1 Tax=Microvirga arvi TaxID=2778731 RepID=UPI003556EC44